MEDRQLLGSVAPLHTSTGLSMSGDLRSVASALYAMLFPISYFLLPTVK